MSTTTSALPHGSAAFVATRCVEWVAVQRLAHDQVGRRARRMEVIRTSCLTRAEVER